jgi:hypothetical protein
VNLKLTKDVDVAYGFRINIKNYKRLKERVEDVVIKIKPKYIIYYSNTTIIKEGYIKEFYKQLL